MLSSTIASITSRNMKGQRIVLRIEQTIMKQKQTNATFSTSTSNFRQASCRVHQVKHATVHNFVIAGSSVFTTNDSYKSISRRLMSSEDKGTTSQTPNEDETISNESATEADVSVDDEEESEEQKLQKQVIELKDQLLRALAEQENIRRIARRDVDNSKAYAVTSFAKSLLDTSDNLSRALEAVPAEHREGDNDVLSTLYKGIEMTDDGLTKAFSKNGLVKFGAVGDVFDPNRHDALFEYVEEGKEVGTIGQVMKVGFELNSRVIRPAEVGVIKKS